MGTFIFKTHAQGACLAATKEVCAPHVGPGGCACLGALRNLINQHANSQAPDSRWDLAQALRMLAKFHMLHRSDLEEAKATAKRALGLVFTMPSTPKIDVCVFELDYAMAMYMAGDPGDKERAKTAWCRIMNYAIDNVTHPGTHSEEDLLYKHALCDKLICEAIELPPGPERLAALRQTLSLANDIGHAHRHMLAVDIEIG